MEKDRDEIFSCHSFKIQILAVTGNRKIQTSVCVCIPLKQTNLGAKGI